MGYHFELIDKTKKEITKFDFKQAVESLTMFNRSETFAEMPWGYSAYSDIKLKEGHVMVSGSFSMSGKYCEGLVLNLLINLQKLGYVIDIISPDFKYDI